MYRFYLLYGVVLEYIYEINEWLDKFLTPPLPWQFVFPAALEKFLSSAKFILLRFEAQSSLMATRADHVNWGHKFDPRDSLGDITVNVWLINYPPKATKDDNFQGVDLSSFLYIYSCISLINGGHNALRGDLTSTFRRIHMGWFFWILETCQNILKNIEFKNRL